MFLHSLLSAAVLAGVFIPSYVGAAGDDQAKALELILNAADRLCNIVSLRGSGGRSVIKGDVKAELKGIASRLVRGGISGAGEIATEEYENVIREDLSSTLRDNAACKLKVFDSLQQKLLKPAESNAPGSLPLRPEGAVADPGAVIRAAMWRGSVLCRNGRHFSVTLSLKDALGKSSSGELVWSGSTKGRDNATLSPDPSGVENSYVLITDQSSSYKYRLRLTEPDQLTGTALGAAKCEISLTR